MTIHRPSIVGAKAKRARAQRHFEELETAVREFFDGHPYVLAIEADPDCNGYVIRLRDPFPVPATEWATIIGDCIHNLRSVFDYIAWELAGGDPNDRDTQFPIFDNQPAFDRNRARMIGRLPAEAQDFIEKVQPYHGHSRGRDPHRHAFWPLHTLDISDKHKLLTVTVAQPVAGAIRFVVPNDDFIYDISLVQDAIFEHNAVIAYIALERFIPLPDLHLEPIASFDIAFDASLGQGKRNFVISSLQQIMGEVDLFIQLFDERFFQ